MKLLIPADYFYKGAPEQNLEINGEVLKHINPATAWDEHIAKEIARIEKEQKGDPNA